MVISYVTPGSITTLSEAISHYLQGLKQSEISCFNTSFYKFTLPGIIESVEYQEGRITPALLDRYTKLLDSITLADIHKLIKIQSKVMSLPNANLSTSAKRQRKYHLNKFVQWCIDNGVISATKREDESKIKRYSLEKMHKLRGELPKTTERTLANIQHLNYELIKGDPVEINYQKKRIEKELEEFKKYRLEVDKVREITHTKSEGVLGRYMGWLCHQKNVPLSEISLEYLIPVYKLQLNPNDYDDYSDCLAEQARNIHFCKTSANNLIHQLEEHFLSKNNKIKPATKAGIIDVFSALAKYLYRKETDTSFAKDYQDVPMVQRLLAYKRRLNKQVKIQRKAEDKIILPWSEIKRVVKILKDKADATHNNKFHYRSLTIRTTDLQRFLLVSFLILIPTDRQRTYRELQLGKTLKYGEFNEEMFIPAGEMADKSQAKWIIDLKSDDYKTGDIYGKWRYYIPNHKFHDATFLYDYIEKWLYKGYQDSEGNWKGMRDSLNPKQPEFFFCRIRVGKPFERACNFSILVTKAFQRIAGVPVTPHQLRHCMRTHIKNIGATKEELDAAAFGMKHSTSVADEVYTHQELQTKLKPIVSLLDRINSDL